MSSVPVCFKLEDTIPPITITPATLLPTPPLTPSSPLKFSKAPTIAHLPAVPTPIQNPPAPDYFPYDHHSLHAPLCRHLALIHPNTPKPIIQFIATRLLSTDRPHGHDGSWTPLWDGCGDLSTAGVGLDAGKGCKQKDDGEGKEIDRKLESMYGVARKSWKVLESMGPGEDMV